MKRALVRILYGEPNNVKHDCLESRSRVNKDIESLILTENNEDFVIYCMGEDNYKYLKLPNNPYLK